MAAAVEGASVVLNCAAYNGVDAAETDPTPAFAVNAVAAGAVAAACAASGARLVHFSTNYVFSGLPPSARPYVESDPASPLGAYARSKVEGERAVLEALPAALVVRSAGLFGHGGSSVKGGSFPDRILARAASGAELRVVSDQYLNPTFTDDLAEATLPLVGSASGVVHLVAAGCCSWRDFAEATVSLAGLSVPVAGVTTAELGAAAPRPLNGCLASERVGPLRPWREALAAFLG